MKKVAVGQAGGPTSVINSSLVGFLEAINVEVFGVFGGFQGLVDENITYINEKNRENIKKFRKVPGACLGAGRYTLSEEKQIKAIRVLQKKDIHCLVFIGGDGTASALYNLSKTAEKLNYELQVIGIPKTVDNDLTGMDHAPGFASAARYIATSTRDINQDLKSMRNFEQVRIIETMGRNSGWLAAASGLLKTNSQDGPQAMYLPEQEIEIEDILTNIKEIVNQNGFATIVVSEGIKIINYKCREKMFVKGRTVLGGVSSEIASVAKKELGFIVREEILGMNQRSSQLATSEQDLREAYQVGKRAAWLVEEESTNVMVGIHRKKQNNYQYFLSEVPLKKICINGENHLPKLFIEDLNAYYKWLKPLVGEDLHSYPEIFI